MIQNGPSAIGYLRLKHTIIEDKKETASRPKAFKYGWTMKFNFYGAAISMKQYRISYLNRLHDRLQLTDFTEEKFDRVLRLQHNYFSLPNMQLYLVTALHNLGLSNSSYKKMLIYFTHQSLRLCYYIVCGDDKRADALFSFLFKYSWTFRLLAIYRNKKTRHFLFTQISPIQLVSMLNKLKKTTGTKNSKLFFSTPLKEVILMKPNGKKRSIKVPNFIYGVGCNMLYCFIAAKSDVLLNPHQNAYLADRSTFHSVAQILSCLITNYSFLFTRAKSKLEPAVPYIIGFCYDLSGFFDNVTHIAYIKALENTLKIKSPYILNHIDKIINYSYISHETRKIIFNLLSGSSQGNSVSAAINTPVLQETNFDKLKGHAWFGFSDDGLFIRVIKKLKFTLSQYEAHMNSFISSGIIPNLDKSHLLFTNSCFTYLGFIIDLDKKLVSIKTRAMGEAKVIFTFNEMKKRIKLMKVSKPSDSIEDTIIALLIDHWKATIDFTVKKHQKDPKPHSLSTMLLAIGDQLDFPINEPLSHYFTLRIILTLQLINQPKCKLSKMSHCRLNYTNRLEEIIEDSMLPELTSLADELKLSKMAPLVTVSKTD